MAPTKRSNHAWGFLDADGWSRCRHCGLMERTTQPQFRGDSRRALRAIIWAAPSGRILRYRPVVYTDAPRVDPSMPTFAESFPDLPVGGVLECPKMSGTWE